MRQYRASEQALAADGSALRGFIANYLDFMTTSGEHEASPMSWVSGVLGTQEYCAGPRNVRPNGRRLRTTGGLLWDKQHMHRRQVATRSSAGQIYHICTVKNSNTAPNGDERGCRKEVTPCSNAQNTIQDPSRIVSDQGQGPWHNEAA